MDLDRYLTYDGVDYECTICERFFASRRAIFDHCRDTSRHEWCEKCERVFLSEPAKNQHLRNSSNHNICWICPQIEDFEDCSDLDDHLVERHHYCDSCDRAHSSARKLREHDVNVHHLCVKCNRFLGNENNLRMVSNSLSLSLFKEALSIVLIHPCLSSIDKLTNPETWNATAAIKPSNHFPEC